MQKGSPAEQGYGLEIQHCAAAAWFVKTSERNPCSNRCWQQLKDCPDESLILELRSRDWRPHRPLHTH
jgi:hypothetical protein